MSATQSTTHRVVKITWIDATGEHDGGEERVHVSRSCLNCDSFAPNPSEEWDAEADGPCMNLCSAAKHADDGAYCPDHQTKAEFEAGRHRPSMPVLTLVGGAA